MPAALIVALILALSAVICVLVIVGSVHMAAKRRARRSRVLPNDGRTAERARKLEEESRRYRNVLTAQLVEDYERERRRR